MSFSIRRAKDSGSVGFVMPTGTVVPFAGSAAPTGWLLCFGQTVSRTIYPDLFATIGTNYGSGDGSTTFALPDMRGRVPAGLDNMGGSAASRLTNAVLSASNTLGATGGSQVHTLTANESGVKSHNHVNTLIGTTTFAGDGHTHAGQGSLHAAIGATNSDAARIGYQAGGVYTNPSTYSIQGGGLVINPNFNHNTPVYGSTGSNSSNAWIGLVNNPASAESASSAHTNTQPTMVLNYIIKV